MDPRLHFVVPTCIIEKDGKFLILKRAAHEKAFPNKWTVPGGKLVLSEYEHLPRGWHNRHSHSDYGGEGGVGRKVQGSSRVGSRSSWSVSDVEMRNPEQSEGKDSKPRVLKEERSDDPQWYNLVEWVLRKEVREEANLEIEKPQYLTDVVFVRPDGYPVVTLSYWAKYKSGEAKPGKDLTDHAWVTVEEAKNYDLIDGIAEEIEEVSQLVK